MVKGVTKSGEKRHTHATINGIEDAEANAINVIGELEIAMLRARRLLEILQVVRQGPHSYKRGNQRRPKRTIIRNDKEQSD